MSAMYEAMTKVRIDLALRSCNCTNSMRLLTLQGHSEHFKVLSGPQVVKLPKKMYAKKLAFFKCNMCFNGNVTYVSGVAFFQCTFS